MIDYEVVRDHFKQRQICFCYSVWKHNPHSFKMYLGISDRESYAGDVIDSLT